MEDLTGLGKLADSKLVNAAYEDLLSKAAREGGDSLVDVVKAFRLFTAPIQLLAVAQDRLAGFCERVRDSVPTERQIEAKPSVAIPILLALRYMEDDNPVTEFFLNLLRKAIDRDRVHEAHPAFAKIIEQLSPDEAMIMYSLREMNYMCVMPSVRQHNSLPFHRLTFPENTRLYCQHLEALNLLHGTASFIELSEFGAAFIRACVPEHMKGVAPFHLPGEDYGELPSPPEKPWKS